MIALLALCLLGFQILSFGQVGISASVGENSNPQSGTAPKSPMRHTPTIEPMTIEEIREMIEREGYNFSVGETWVSTLSPTEIASLLGDTPSEIDLGHLNISSMITSGGSSTVGVSPPAFDYRDYGQVTFPKDQSTCGSCWAFAGTGRLESRILIEGGPAYDLSEENLLSCNIYGKGCDGGSDFYTVNYFSKIGACLES
jgi:C1A family cysteine protease